MKTLKHFPAYTVKSSVGIFIASIYTDNGTLFCKVNGDTKKEADTNAKLIVKCMNGHDDMLDGIKTITEEIDKRGKITITKGSVIDTTLKLILKNVGKK